jgi:flagellar protein FlgJ
MLVRQLGDHSETNSASRLHPDGFPFNPQKDGRVFNGLIRSPAEILQKARSGLFNRSPDSSAMPVESTDQTMPTTANESTEKTQQFIQTMYPHAQQAAEKLGVQPEVLLAQAALETGWGRHMIQHPNGSNSFNLFGIKASHDWQGERVAVSSLEYDQGVARKQLSAFRAYDSYASSFADYAELISSRPRYQGAINNAADPEAYLHALQDAGYATDPRYAEKIIGILKRNDLIPAPGQQVMLENVSAKSDEG